MKITFRLPARSVVKFAFTAVILMAFTTALPLWAQSSSDTVPAGSVADAVPPSMQKTVQVMVELTDPPAAVPYAEAYKAAVAQADAARAYALAHPRLKSSQAVLKSKQTVQISSTAVSRVKTAVQKNDQAQKVLLARLTAPDLGGQVMFRAQRAYNGIAMIVSPDKISQIASLPGVKAVHPMNPKFFDNTFSDIDFLNTRTAWTKLPLGLHGENIKVADIDSGLDYIHVNFGGSGSSADYAATTDTSAVPNANFPTPKIPGGIDLVGDSYDANPNNPTYQPIPHQDPNPMDCGGHGTGTASLIAGYGETNAGFTYSGTYDAVNPDMTTLKIPPGFAPNAKLYPVRVFGCGGSTNVVTEAIEWAMDPNGDGDFSDHMDVINMSLGANEGFADDADDIAAANAAAIGVQVCSAAGNAGDSYYIHSSPAAASGTLSCAASFNDQAGFIADSNVTGNAPPAIAGSVFYSIKGNGSAPIPGGGVTGNVVYAVPPDAATDGAAGGNTPLTNAAQVAGNIVVINRGTSGFADKVKKGLNAGAIAVIVNNFNNPTADPITMATTPQPVGVDVMISRTSRDTIVSATGGDPTTTNGYNAGAMTGFDPVTGVPTTPVNVTINNDNFVVTHGGAAPDTIPTYTSRGPRLPDSAIKPDITAPAEVTAVAVVRSGTSVANFNGTSSATPHISGIMALLRQLHPTWTVQELNALATSTATHDLFTTAAHTTQFGVGRIGAGRVDVGNAANSNVVAYNGTDANLIGVSFGVVEAPVTSTTTLVKNITITNKGGVAESYTPSIQNAPALAGATFTLPAGPINVGAGATVNVPVTLTVTGSALKHVLEASASPHTGQWLTEAGGYAVFTPADASPTLRVTLYAAPKPISSMTAGITGFVPPASTGSFNISLTGSPVNTGASLGTGTDIRSLVKALELQYASTDAGAPAASVDPNVIKYVGVTSDFPTRTPASATRVVFGIDGFGNAATPDFASSDREIFIDTYTGNGPGGGPDGIFDYAAFLASSGGANQFVPIIVNLHSGAQSAVFFTNGQSAAVADTNIFNNSAGLVPVQGTGIGLFGVGGTSPTLFQYQVVTFNRNGDEVDETPVLTYDVSKPGLEVENSGNVAGVTSVFSSTAAFRENFYYEDLPTNFIPVNYNGTNFQANGSLGVLLLHMHNGTGHHSDVVAFRKPTVSGFSPTSGKVGSFVTITGSNFGPGTVVKFFNNQVATVNVLTANTLTAVVPAGAVTGPIKVSNAAGSSTAPGNFTVLP